MLLCTWTGYAISCHRLPHGTLGFLEVHAMERDPDNPGDDLCVECSENPDIDF